MIEYLSLEQVHTIQKAEIDRLGGQHGVLKPEVVESALDLMAAGFGDFEYHPTLAEKAACLGFSLATGHAFIDGNKRVAYQAMEVFLNANGWEFVGVVDEQEQMMLALAASKLTREEFTA